MIWTREPLPGLARPVVLEAYAAGAEVRLLLLDGGVPGAWSVDEVVQALGGPGTTQGCP